MIGRQFNKPIMQSVFYRDSYHKVLHALMISIVIIWFLVIAIIYVALFNAAPQYYATTSEGQIIPMTPVS